MGRCLTEAQKHGGRIRDRGKYYESGYTRDEIKVKQMCFKENFDGCVDGSKENYIDHVQSMLDYLDEINKPIYVSKKELQCSEK
jgi:hypothetical protein